MGLVGPRHVGSNVSPLHWKSCLNHWTREVPVRPNFSDGSSSQVGLWDRAWRAHGPVGCLSPSRLPCGLQVVGVGWERVPPTGPRASDDLRFCCC